MNLRNAIAFRGDLADDVIGERAEECLTSNKAKQRT